MDKQDHFSPSLPGNDYPFDQHQQQGQPMSSRSDDENHPVNYTMDIDMLQQHQQQQNQHQMSSGFYPNNSLDRLSFADVMQFADFGPKLALNHEKIPEEEPGMDPAGYFLKFPVLNDKFEDENLIGVPGNKEEDRFRGGANLESSQRGAVEGEEEEEGRGGDSSVQLQFLGENTAEKKNPANPEGKGKRKRPRTVKTNEEVESQRMTHIAVERNRRKQMNEHLRVLRSLMPGSYVQRGDQASIIGGAIEFVRELEQLLQCLESQKRRRIFGGGGGGEDSSSPSLALIQPPLLPPLAPLQNEEAAVPNFDSGGFREETAERKSCLADVEVKVLGFDAMIKILSKRRPQQLLKTIAALEDLQLNIIHTNITTIEHTVLYSFNVKVSSESRFTAEDIASSVQQIFGFIHANSGVC